MASVLVPTAYLYPPLTVLVLYTVHFFGGFMFLARKVNDFYFAAPDSFRQVQLTTYAFPFVLLLLVVATIRLWWNKEECCRSESITP